MHRFDSAFLGLQLLPTKNLETHPTPKSDKVQKRKTDFIKNVRCTPWKTWKACGQSLWALLAGVLLGAGIDHIQYFSRHLMNRGWIQQVPDKQRKAIRTVRSRRPWAKRRGPGVKVEPQQWVNSDKLISNLSIAASLGTSLNLFMITYNQEQHAVICHGC